jgi:SAM-dependent methyltransferase
MATSTVLPPGRPAMPSTISKSDGIAARHRREAVLRRILPGSATVALEEGALCLDGRSVPVSDGVIRFRSDDGYNASFARQWHAFAREQIDAANGTSLTRDRLLRETGWQLDELAGELVLEAGCGAGRFTTLLASSGAELVSFDYSAAVEVAVANAGGAGNVTFLQADILDMPFREGVFDRVFCHGVLQHTPDPAGAFRALDRVLRPGGVISIDVYLKDGKIRPWKAKYLWRPLTTRMDPETLLAFLEWFIPKWLPFDTALKRIPVLGRYLGAVIPCFNYFYTPLSSEDKRRWAIMDTFDALAPTYDNPMTIDEVRGWFRDMGYQEFEVREGGNGVVGNGCKPLAA